MSRAKRKADISVELPIVVTLTDYIPDGFGDDYSDDQEFRSQKSAEVLGQVTSCLLKHLPKRYEDVQQAYIDMPQADVKPH